MADVIFLVHGRGPKPPCATLTQTWVEAMRFAIERDHPDRLAQFDSVAKTMIYYGDISMDFFQMARTSSSRNLVNRDREVLFELKTRTPEALFSRVGYTHLMERPTWRTLSTHVLAILAATTKLGIRLIKNRYPDVAAYWDRASRFHQAIHQRFGPFLEALARGDRVFLISHSLGTVVSYEYLWELSQMLASQGGGTASRLDTFVTLGSPLADESMKHRLLGWHLEGRQRFPTNIRRWINISAEDDTICHDPCVANDFAGMLRLGLVEQIQDLRIRNPARREGRLDPHSVIGYLIHPTTSGVIATWLDEDTPPATQPPTRAVRAEPAGG